MSVTTAYGNGIFSIDSGYVREGFAAIYLMVERGRAAFIETGCNSAMPRVMAALATHGLGPEAVDYVIPTHVHLDHAGGAGAMMRAFPNAKLVVHPRGVRHMVDPTKLVAGAVAVYGEQATRALYGDIVPVAPDRIVEASDGLCVDLAGRTLRCLDVQGHAKHHIVVVDEASRQIFTGDTFGVAYAELDGPERRFVFPTTTPVQFDPQALQASMARLMALQPEAMLLTHFGRLADVARAGADLHRHIDAFVAIGRAAAGSGEARHRAMCDQLWAYALDEVRAVGCTLPEARIRALLANDIELNAQGVEIWLESQSAAR